MSARKDDQGKAPISLIPRSALEAEARVMAHGKAKYGAHNWRGGMEWSRCIDAVLRHVLAFASGEDIDDGQAGSGESHLANARCGLAFLIEFQEKGLGTDDRWRAGERGADLSVLATDPPKKMHKGYPIAEITMTRLADHRLVDDTRVDEDGETVMGVPSEVPTGCLIRVILKTPGTWQYVEKV